MITRVKHQIIPTQEEQPQTPSCSYEDSLKFISSIPNSFPLVHKFEYYSQCQKQGEVSTFDIPTIGQLSLGETKQWKCCKKCNCTCKIFPCDCKPACTCCANCQCVQKCCVLPETLHAYRGAVYRLQNENVIFEYYGRFAKLFIKDNLVLEFEQCFPNVSDIICGAWKSGFPQIKVYNPRNKRNNELIIRPQENRCPERPCGLYPCQPCCSYCACSDLKRDFYVEGLNGKCTISTTRDKTQACRVQSGCWNGCADSCHFVNYPNMDFNFEGVSDVDKLAIIFSAIHHSITNRWGLLAWNGEFKSNLPEYNYYTF